MPHFSLVSLSHPPFFLFMQGPPDFQQNTPGPVPSNFNQGSRLSLQDQWRGPPPPLPPPPPQEREAFFMGGTTIVSPSGKTCFPQFPGTGLGMSHKARICHLFIIWPISKLSHFPLVWSPVFSNYMHALEAGWLVPQTFPCTLFPC